MIKEKEASKADRLEMLKMRNSHLTKDVKEKNDKIKKYSEKSKVHDVQLTPEDASLAPTSFRPEPNQFYSQTPRESKENDDSETAKTQ